MKSQKSSLKRLFAGALVGLVNGFFGGGGGMIAVPLLEKTLKVPQKIAHATAIFVILPLSLASGMVYAALGSFPVAQGCVVGAGVVLGGIAGTLSLGKLPEKVLFWTFTALMLFSGAWMLLR